MEELPEKQSPDVNVDVASSLGLHVHNFNLTSLLLTL